MNNNTLTNVTISQLRRFGGMSEEDNDDFLVIRRIGQPELFHYPCRVDAVVLAVCHKGHAMAEINLTRYEVTEGMSVVSLPDNVIQVLQVSDDFEGYVIVVSLDFLRSAQIDLKNILPLYMYIKNHPCVRFPPRAMAEIGQPVMHSGLRHWRQRCASSMTCIILTFSSS